MVRGPGEQSKTILPPLPRPRAGKDLDAGPLEAEVGSFALHMAAEGKAPRTIRNYTEAVRWFAATYVLPGTEKRRWQDVDTADLRRWTVRLLDEYSTAYAGNQFRAVRRFLRWLAVEEDRRDPDQEITTSAVQRDYRPGRGRDGPVAVVVPGLGGGSMRLAVRDAQAASSRRVMTTSKPRASSCRWALRALRLRSVCRACQSGPRSR